MITESGSPVRLQPQPFKLLVYLATQSGRLVTRAEIREHLWGKDTYVDFEASLNYCISQVRNALADNAEDPRFIETYPKRGYRFICPVETAHQSVPLEKAHPARAIPPEAPKVIPHSFKRARLLVTAALSALLVLVIWRFTPSPGNGASPQMAIAASRSEPAAQAHDAYLRGQYEWHQRTNGWKRGCEYFSEATQKDPRFAAAYAALSNCYRLLVGYNALAPREGFAKAEEAARRAILLDPTAAASHTATGSNLLYIDWNWPAAHAEFKQALRLNPNDAESHMEYGRFLRLMGDFEGAIREATRAVELDPLSNIARLSLCAAYADSNQLERAVDECNRSIQLQPDSENAYIFLSQLFARQQKYDESSLATVKALRIEGKDKMAQDFVADYQKLGFEAAEAHLAQAMQEEYRDPKGYERQLLFMQMGTKDSAIAFLQEAYLAHDPVLISIKSDPTFSFLHDDPRFQDLLSKMRFDTY